MDTNKGDTLTETVLEAPRVTIRFERKVQVRDYESATASITIDAPTHPGDDINAMVEAAEAAFFAGKGVIFNQLGITFDVTPDGKAMELLEQKLGAVEVTREAEAQAIAQASRPSVTSDAPAPNSKDGLWLELAEYPKRWFDNRASKAERGGNGPDFKRKKSGEGLWLEYRGRTNVPEGVQIPEPAAF